MNFVRARVYRNLVDISLVDDLMRGYIIGNWDKYSAIADEHKQVSPLFADWTDISIMSYRK